LQIVAQAQKEAEKRMPPPQDNICYTGDRVKYNTNFKMTNPWGICFSLVVAILLPLLCCCLLKMIMKQQRYSVPFPCVCNTNPNIVDCPSCGFETNELEDNG
jgi:hypothetical protein